MALGYYDGYYDGQEGYFRRDDAPWSDYACGYHAAEHEIEEAREARAARQRHLEEEDYYDRLWEESRCQPEPEYPEPTLDDICAGHGHPFESWKYRYCACGKTKRGRFACVVQWIQMFRYKISKEHRLAVKKSKARLAVVKERNTERAKR